MYTNSCTKFTRYTFWSKTNTKIYTIFCDYYTSYFYSFSELYFSVRGEPILFVKSAENYIEIHNKESVNLDITLDCGQAFRWKQNADLSWSGVVRGIETTVEATDNGLRFYGITENQFNDVFLDYFDFNRDYAQVLDTLSADRHLAEAINNYGTIRILRQEPWEALCSFIISACNNITRIKGIIDRLCTNYGEKTGASFSFPSAEKIASLDAEALEVIRAGYRVPYILDAARKVSDGTVNLEALFYKSTEECEKELMQINGVGKKVADCTILFGLGHVEAFPVDRHIRRICDKLYPDGLPVCTKGIEGIAQQYMFHLQRTGNIL